MLLVAKKPSYKTLYTLKFEGGLKAFPVSPLNPLRSQANSERGTLNPQPSTLDPLNPKP